MGGVLLWMFESLFRVFYLGGVYSLAGKERGVFVGYDGIFVLVDVVRLFFFYFSVS